MAIIWFVSSSPFFSTSFWCSCSDKCTFSPNDFLLSVSSREMTSSMILRLGAGWSCVVWSCTVRLGTVGALQSVTWCCFFISMAFHSLVTFFFLDFFLDYQPASIVKPVVDIQTRFCFVDKSSFNECINERMMIPHPHTRFGNIEFIVLAYMLGTIPPRQSELCRGLTPTQRETILTIRKQTLERL